MDYTWMFGVNFFQSALDWVITAVSSIFTKWLFAEIMPFIILIAFALLVVFGIMSFAFGFLNISWTVFSSEDSASDLVKWWSSAYGKVKDYVKYRKYKIPKQKPLI